MLLVDVVPFQDRRPFYVEFQGLAVAARCAALPALCLPLAAPAGWDPALAGTKVSLER